jgi:hypothetical protein
MKVVFLLERPRPQRSSPSLRQIALVVVTAGLGIMVVRVVVRRKSHGADAGPEPVLADTSQTETFAQADAVPPESAEAEAAQPDSAADAEAAQADSAEAQAAQSEGAEVPKQDQAHDASSTPPSRGNDSVPATESSLTDTVQSEMSRRGDAPTPAGGSD